MFKLIAYVLAFFLAPIIGSLAGLVFVPLVAAFSKVKPLSTAIALISNTAVGFIAFWFTTVVFSWFNLQPTILMAIILAFGFALNDFRRIAGASERASYIEISSGIGDFFGIVVGAIYFL